LHMDYPRNENSISYLRKIGFLEIIFKLKFHITVADIAGGKEAEGV